MSSLSGAKMTKKIIRKIPIILTALLLLAVLFSCLPKTYTITFDPTGGSPVKPVKTAGKTTLFLPPSIRDGYNFEGWFLDKDNWKQEIGYNTFADKRLKRDITVYAKWTFIGYTVYFVSNGGSAAEPRTIGKNGVLESPPFMEREGYTFLGWCTDYTLTTFYQFGTPVNNSFTLYAKWVADEDNKEYYEITFVSNGGSDIPSASVPEGEAYYPPQPSRQGYSFVGWYVDSALTIPYPTDNIVTNNLTLYAKWSPNPAVYTLTFDARGGSEPQPLILEAGQRPEEPVSERDGYRFLGWYKDTELTQPYNFSVGAYGSFTLYAKWEKIPDVYKYYDIFYYSDGALLITFKLEEGSFAPERQETRENYIFSGWFADEELTVPFDFSERIYADTYLYAKWTEKNDTQDGGYTYKLSDDGGYYTVTAYSGQESAVLVPSSYNGIPVREIGVEAFKGSIGLTSVTLPDTITEIGARAFSGLKELTTVVFTSSPAVGAYLFSGCTALTSIDLGGLTAVSDYMFYGCTALTEIALPASIVEIKSNAFNGAVKLNTVTIPDACGIIGDKAFYGCFALSGINLNKVETIDSEAFSKSGLTQISLSEVKTVGPRAFSECPKLETVYIGGALVSADYAFLQSFGIKRYEVSEDNLQFKAIGNNLYAKDGKKMILYAAGQEETAFSVPEGVEVLSAFCFAGAKLVTLNISSAVNRLEETALSEMPLLTAVTVSESNEGFTATGGVLYNKAMTALIKYPADKDAAEFVIPETVTTVAPYSFMRAKNLQKITLSLNTETISSYAFYEASITTVELSGAPLKTIGASALEGCAGLKSFPLSAALETIGERAFAGTGLTEISIGNAVKTLGTEAFADCINLTYIRFGTGIETLSNNAFSGCPALKKLEFFGAPASIGNAFNGCGTIEEVIITGTGAVTEIDTAAFSSAVNLPVLKVQESMVSQYSERYGQTNIFSAIEAL